MQEAEFGSSQHCKDPQGQLFFILSRSTLEVRVSYYHLLRHMWYYNK